MRESARIVYERQLLMGARWAPVTTAVLFIRASPRHAAEALSRGQRAQHVLATTGIPVQIKQVQSDSLEGSLAHLLPLEAPIDRRQLFVATRNPAWCAMFSSNWRGLDPGGFMRAFEGQGLDTVAVVDSPHDPKSRPGGVYGARQIIMYRFDPDVPSAGRMLGVRAATDTRWELDRSPEEFDGGNFWDPDAPRLRDRFTHDHLVQMAARLGLRPFDEDFFVPEVGSVMLNDTTLTPTRWLFATLAQARGEEPPPEVVDIR